MEYCSGDFLVWSAEVGMVCGVCCSELLLCFGYGWHGHCGAVHIQLYLPVSTFLAHEVREAGSFSLGIESQDLKNWQGWNSDTIYQQNDEG